MDVVRMNCDVFGLWLFLVGGVWLVNDMFKMFIILGGILVVIGLLW